MIRNTLSRLVLPVVATAALLIAAGPALAQHGGYHGGGFHAGGVHPGGVYHGGFGGYHNGYHPYYNGYRVYPHYGYGYYPYYNGGWSYPYYNYGYYPDTSNYADTSTSGYYSPSTTDSANDSTTPVTQATVTGDNSAAVSSARAARIAVRLPDAAELWFDSARATSTGSVRVFTTPPLAPGQKYTYEVRAHWLDNDTTMDQKQSIVFAPGDNVEVTFPTPAGTGAKVTNGTLFP